VYKIDRPRYVQFLPFLVVYVIMICGCGTVDKQPPVATIKPIPESSLVLPRKEEPSILSLPSVNVAQRKWRYIVIHHSATPSGSANAFDEFHRKEKGWDRGLGYHFVIGNGNGARNGLVEAGPRWLRQVDGAHAGSVEYNQHGIGVCLVGDFEAGDPTGEQVSSLVELVKELQQVCNIPPENIIMHRHIRDTQCPGGNFPYYEVLANLPR